MRLIDADALVKDLCENYIFTGFTELLNDFANVIKSQPTVDAVPVIRCKDCKWYGRADKRRFYRGMDCLNKRIDTIVPDKDFCSRAERKEHETD